VIELPVGVIAISGTRKGDQLQFSDLEPNLSSQAFV